MKVNVLALKSIVEKLNLAIEKSTLNPKSGWIEMMEEENGNLSIYVCNFDYFVDVCVKCVEGKSDIPLHATVSSDTFIPLISKLDDGTAEFRCNKNTLVVETDSGEYTFPVIKEAGRPKSVDRISFNCNEASNHMISGEDISSIASINAKGLLDSVFSREIQQYIYVDEVGAITFTENIYINAFNGDRNTKSDFKFLLTGTQAKLMKIFEKADLVDVEVLEKDYENPIKVKFSYFGNDYSISLVIVAQARSVVDKFPSIKLRQLSSAVSETHAIIDKKKLEKALQRLMVFDKKFDITVLNYSKLVFGVDEVKLVSIKNNNYEVVKYLSGQNTIEHESIIRFADLVNQLKAVQGKEIDISYGQSPAITINSYRLKQLIPEVRERGSN